MYNFTKEELIDAITKIENQHDLLNFSSKYNSTKISIEKPCLICDINCFVDGEESYIGISISDDCELGFDIWIGDHEYFVNDESQLEKLN
ncbi:hypothetical protein [Gluconobacter sp. OJB]|uniref:hypothetical protein n=1 Tax=Gluconobacter sp. OJB TaxID=3145196 RepID=UPI0031F799C3